MSEVEGKAREAWCLLGIPFDAVTVEGACRLVAQCIREEGKTILSTPNVNFLVLTRKDAAFHKQIVLSEINTIDGMPLYWCARFLGIPIPERVSGYDLAARLWEEKKEKKTVYFFGGQGTVTKEAFEHTNKSSPGLRAVGFANPGYGSAEALSRTDLIENINKTRPDMIWVSLGAKKGTEWIFRNRERLQTKFITHLGDAVNILAGHFKRAPYWMQISGLEWLWRIFQQPVLCKRYFLDGIDFLKIFFWKIVPLKYFLWKHRKEEKETAAPTILIQKNDGETVIIIRGICNRNHRNQIRDVFKEAVNENSEITVDLRKTRYIESSFLGSLLLLWRAQHLKEKKVRVIHANKTVQAIFKLFMVEHFFNFAKNSEK